MIQRKLIISVSEKLKTDKHPVVNGMSALKSSPPSQMKMCSSMFSRRYLNEEHLRGFDNYKYSSVDTSPVSKYISHPWWNQAVKLCPLWLAPNLLTFMGLLFVLAVYSVISFYDYQLWASSDRLPEFPPIPSWVWIFASVGTFLAHTLDGIDGKQARRTGSSGPTGELFDHGIDSWLTVPFTVTIFSIFGRADYSVSAFRQLLVLITVQLCFIVTHFEKYNTGVLFLSWGYDISQYGLTFAYFATWIGGYRMWKFFLVPQLNIYPAHILEFGFYLTGFGVSIPMSLYNIYQASKAGTLKQTSLYEALLPLFSTIFLFLTAVWWALMSPANVVDVDPRAFYWTMGTIFSNIACRLIVSQMTQTRCEPLNWLLYPYVAVAVGAVMWPWPSTQVLQVELFLLRFMAVFVTIAHVHYGVYVVRQMCEHFNIYAFTLKRPVTITVEAKKAKQIEGHEAIDKLLDNVD